jgi:sugar phosphate isomerase/epimerase
MILIGAPFRAHLDDVREMARRHRADGYTAAYCPRIAIGERDRIVAVREAFAAEGLPIAEIGAWCNLLATDPAKRRANLDRVSQSLAIADEVGALCCVDYLGTYDPGSDYGPHPDNLTPRGFDAAVETIRAVIDAARPRRAKFCLEMMQWVLPDSVDCYLDLLRAVDRPAFGVHLDPVNLIVSPRMYYDTAAVIRDCFRRLGPRIVSCHAKDLVLRNALALHMDEVRPGLGQLDYRVYLAEIQSLGREVPLMLEHLTTPEEYAQARDYLRGVEASLDSPDTKERRP